MYRALSTGAIGVRVDFEQKVALAKQAGFEGLEIDLAEVKAYGIKEARALLDSAGLVPAGTGLPVDWQGAEEKYRRTLNELSAWADLAHEFGLDRFVTWVPPCSDTRLFAENFAFHVERFRPAAQILADKSCRLGLEFIGPQTSRTAAKYDFVYSMDGMLALCAALGTGNAGLLLDAWHWYTACGTIADIEKLQDSDIVYVHLNDAPAGIPVGEQRDHVRALPGETGVIDLAGFLAALRHLDYTGPVVVEPFSERLHSLSAEQAVAETAASLDKVWHLLPGDRNSKD